MKRNGVKFGSAVLAFVASLAMIGCPQPKSNPVDQETPTPVEPQTPNPGTKPVDVKVTGVTVDPVSADLASGDTMYIDVAVAPANAKDKSFTVTASNPDALELSVEDSVITVTAKEVTETVTVTVKTTDGEFEAVSTINVVAPVYPTAISVPAELEVKTNKTATAEVTFEPAEATKKMLEVTSDNEEAATVSVKNGVITVTGVKAGKANITVHAKDGTEECADQTIAVTVSDIAVEAVEITSDANTVEVGSTLALIATVLPEDATDKTVTWESDNEEVATVEDGVVTAVSIGKATITAKAGDKTATCEVTVTGTKALPVMAGTKQEGAVFQIILNCTELGLNEWAADVENGLKKGTDYKVSLKSGETPKDYFFTAPDFGSNPKKMMLQINLATGEAKTETVTVEINVKGQIFAGNVDFKNGQWIPANYTVEGLTVTPAGKKMKSGATQKFVAKDSIYGIEQTVTWSADVGTIAADGTYTAPEAIEEDTTATITAKYSDSVSGSVTVALLADSTEAAPYEVSLSNEGGAWMKTTITWTDPANEIAADSSKYISGNLSVDGDAHDGVNWASAGTNSVTFAKAFGSANLTNPGVTQTYKFRVEAKNGNKYDFVVICKGGNPDMTVEECTVTAVSELTLSVSKLVFESMDAQAVTVGAVGIADFNAAEVTAVSKNEAVAEVSYADGTLTVTPVADGETTVEVTFGTYKAELPVAVQTSLEEVTLVFASSSKIVGAGIELYYDPALPKVPENPEISVVFDGGTDFKGYESQITKSGYNTVWSRTDGMHFTVAAGFPDGGDYTHDVTVSFVMDGKKYTGTAHFEGNAFVSSN